MMSRTEGIPEVEALKADLAKIRDDLSRLKDVLKESGREELAAARERLEREARKLMEELKRSSAKVTDEGRRQIERIEREIESHPLQSLGLAFGIGLLLGVLFGRRA